MNLDSQEIVEKRLRDANANEDLREEIADYWLTRISTLLEEAKREERERIIKIVSQKECYQNCSCMRDLEDQLALKQN